MHQGLAAKHLRSLGRIKKGHASCGDKLVAEFHQWLLCGISVRGNESNGLKGLAIEMVTSVGRCPHAPAFSQAVFPTRAVRLRGADAYLTGAGQSSGKAVQVTSHPTRG